MPQDHTTSSEVNEWALSSSEVIDARPLGGSGPDVPALSSSEPHDLVHATSRRDRDHDTDPRTQPQPTDNGDPLPSQNHPRDQFSLNLTILLHLSLFSILGTLSRLSLSSLTSYPSVPITFPVLWSNLAGSLVIGYLSQFSSSISFATSPLKPTPLYIGLATGYCGSLTSFSTFMRDVFLAIANESLPPSSPSRTAPPRARGYSLLAPLAIIIVTITVSFTSLQLGASLARLKFRTYEHRAARPFHHPLLCTPSFPGLLAVITLAVLLLLTLLPSFTHTHSTSRPKYLFPLLFSPAGCLLRYHLSNRLNPKLPRFPLGTITANTLACLIFAIAWTIRHLRPSRIRGDITVSEAVLYGLEEGLCGCLSTVSTWILELDTLAKKKGGAAAWIYGGVSIAVGSGLLIAIIGGSKWSHSFDTNR